MTKITLCLRGWTFAITCVWFDTTPINTGFRHNSFLRGLKLICDLYCCPAPYPDHHCLCFIPRPRDFRTACNYCAIHNVFHLRFGALLCSNNIKRLVNSKLFSFANQFPLYRLSLAPAIKVSNNTSSGSLYWHYPNSTLIRVKNESVFQVESLPPVAYISTIWAPSQYKDRLIYVWRFPC